MSNESTGNFLIKELNKNPYDFYKKGKSYQLLQEYFKGYEIDTLRDLLKKSDPYIKRAAIWIASELGYESRSLLKEVVPLAIDDEDEYIQSYALEVLTVCAHGEHCNELIPVIKSLQSKRKFIRLLAMRLVEKLTTDQIAISIKHFKSSNALHVEGLLALGEINNVTAEQASAMITSKEPLIRKYGAIITKCKFQSNSDLIMKVAKSTDPDLQEFFHGFSKMTISGPDPD